MKVKVFSLLIGAMSLGITHAAKVEVTQKASGKSIVVDNAVVALEKINKGEC